MDGNNSHPFSRLVKILLVVLVLFGITLPLAGASANDLPLAAGSPLAGFAFDDRPLLLSVQRNFQMAMLTSASELGRSCGKMEAYGWRMGTTEQQRVNQIFNNTVDRLRALGYVVESQTPSSVSRDITLFTADRPDKHFIFMWSAGEIGLVMVLCESSSLLSNHTVMAGPSVQVFPQTEDVLKSKAIAPVKEHGRKVAASKFSPVGSWVGSYTCEQGSTGGTLDITHLQGEHFDGVFRFYPTPKNPYASSGKYEVYGEYDADTQRILINPGKWLERPKGYYNTIIVGNFDPVEHSFSGYFQGITGCTSFEAKQAGATYEMAKDMDQHIVVKPKPKKKAHKKKPAVKKAVATKAAAATVQPATKSEPTPAKAPAPAAPVGPAAKDAPTKEPASAAPSVAPATPAAPDKVKPQGSAAPASPPLIEPTAASSQPASPPLVVPPTAPASAPSATAAPTPVVAPTAPAAPAPSSSNQLALPPTSIELPAPTPTSSKPTAGRVGP